MNKLLVAQLGARRHYAVPRMLHAHERLDRLCTDVCAVKGFPRLLGWLPKALQPAPVKRLLGRTPDGIPAGRIRAFNDLGFEYARRRMGAATPTEATAAHLWAGRNFCERILERGLGNADGVYTFNSAGLELLAHGRRSGLRTVMEQTIAPMQIEIELLREEHERFPDWQEPMPANGVAAEFIAREKAEWAESDLILCGSEFVRDGIAQCGGPAERCTVVPYGVDGLFRPPERSRLPGPLRVLIAGEIGLRKGSPHVLAAARLLGSRAQFRMVGSISVRPATLGELKAHLEVKGPVMRSAMLDEYAWADVFLLPSLCEGSAAVTYEALACGLPVVTTPNTGSIVRDGQDGFIVPVRNPEAIASRLEAFAAKPDLVRAFSSSARERSQEGTLEAYARRLNAALGHGEIGNQRQP